MGFRENIGKIPTVTLPAGKCSRESELQARALEVLIKFKAKQTLIRLEPVPSDSGCDSRRHSTASDSALLRPRKPRHVVGRNTESRTSSTSLPEMCQLSGADMPKSERLSGSVSPGLDTPLAKLRAKFNHIGSAVKARMRTSDQDLTTCRCDVSASHVMCIQSQRATSTNDDRVVTVIVGEFHSDWRGDVCSACPYVDLSSRMTLMSLSNGRCTTGFNITETRKSDNVFVNIHNRDIELCCEHAWQCTSCNMRRTRVCKMGFARLPPFLDTSALRVDYDDTRDILVVVGNVQSPFSPKVKAKVTTVKFDKKTIAKRHQERLRTGGVIIRKMYDNI